MEDQKRRVNLKGLIVSTEYSKSLIIKTSLLVRMRVTTIGLKIHLQGMRHSQSQLLKLHQTKILQTFSVVSPQLKVVSPIKQTFLEILANLQQQLQVYQIILQTP